MRFESTHKLLDWYFNFADGSAPRKPGNHLLKIFKSQKRNIPLEDIWETHLKISHVLSKLKWIEKKILTDYFKKGCFDIHLNEKLKIKDRRIRQLKQEILIILDFKFKDLGLIEILKPTEKPKLFVESQSQNS